MEQIGIRELRQNASVWVSKAKAGAVIQITDRGRPVARLVPLTAAEQGRNKLIADGHLIPANVSRGRLSVDNLIDAPPLTPMLDEQRSER